MYLVCGMNCNLHFQQVQFFFSLEYEASQEAWSGENNCDT